MAATDVLQQVGRQNEGESEECRQQATSHRWSAVSDVAIKVLR